MSQNDQIMILVKGLNNRVHYILRHVFFKILGVRPIITNDKDAFLQCSFPKLNYTLQRLGDEPYIYPGGLVYEKGICPHDIKVDQFKDFPVLFYNGNEEFPFDVFSAVFYMISRYEEYLAFHPDKYNRFPVVESIAWKYNFLDVPIVDKWIYMLVQYTTGNIVDDYSNGSFNS